MTDETDSTILLLRKLQNAYFPSVIDRYIEVLKKKGLLPPDFTKENLKDEPKNNS